MSRRDLPDWLWLPIKTAHRDGRLVIVGFVETSLRKRPRKSYVTVGECRDDVWWPANDYDDGIIRPQPTHWTTWPDPSRTATSPEGNTGHFYSI